jgi:hypothetical protein
MVANYTSQPAFHRHDFSLSAEKRSRTRHYDSFVVRLWRGEGSEAMLRVEVQHVQAGLSMEAVQVPLDWIVPEMLGCLQISMSEPVDARHSPAQAPNDSSPSADNRSRTRHYDSFVVRLWRGEGSEAMLRVEVQHVQAGLSMEAVQVPLDWIVPEMLGCLAMSAQSSGGHSGQEVR